jgi:hypothetical protein
VTRQFHLLLRCTDFEERCVLFNFRSSIMFAFGNALEFATLRWPNQFLVCFLVSCFHSSRRSYIFEGLFQLIAAVATALKQVGILTHGSTRNPM